MTDHSKIYPLVVSLWSERLLKPNDAEKLVDYILAQQQCNFETFRSIRHTVHIIVYLILLSLSFRFPNF